MAACSRSGGAPCTPRSSGPSRRSIPGRAGERSSWLTLHAFRGEVWDRAVAYLPGQRPADPGRVPSGLTGGDNPGAAWWMGDHEHVIRAAPAGAGRRPAHGRRVAHPLDRRDEPPARSGPPFARPVLPRAMDALRKNVELLARRPAARSLRHGRAALRLLPGLAGATVWPSEGSSARHWPIGEEALRIAETGDPASASSSGASASGTCA